MGTKRVICWLFEYERQTNRQTTALGAAVMALWNAILPEVVGAKPLSYWQALGLLLLSRILFGGFRFGGGGPPWKGRRRGRWANLSEEERAHMKEAWRKRCNRS